MSDMHHSFKNSVDKTEDTTKRNSLEELVDLNWFALKLPIRFAAKREVVVSYTVDGVGGLGGSVVRSLMAEQSHDAGGIFLICSVHKRF